MGNETSKNDGAVPVTSITPAPSCFKSALTNSDNAFLCYHSVPLFVTENPDIFPPENLNNISQKCHRMVDDPNMWICGTQPRGVQRHFTHLMTEFSHAEATRDYGDCEGVWSSWSGCSQACGPGTQTKRFSVTKNANGGASCLSTYGADDDDVITRECTGNPPCPVNCRGEWRVQDDAACTKSCGGGQKKRTFHIIENAAHGGNDNACKNASGQWLEEEFVECNTHNCPVSCRGAWVSDGDCVDGKMHYTYSVTVPESHGGTCVNKNRSYDANCRNRDRSRRDKDGEEK